MGDDSIKYLNFKFEVISKKLLNTLYFYIYISFFNIYYIIINSKLIIIINKYICN